MMQAIKWNIQKYLMRKLLPSFISRQIEADTRESNSLVDCATTILDEVRK